jgi:hypothetical protein
VFFTDLDCAGGKESATFGRQLRGQLHAEHPSHDLACLGRSDTHRSIESKEDARDSHHIENLDQYVLAARSFSALSDPYQRS